MAPRLPPVYRAASAFRAPAPLQEPKLASALIVEDDRAHLEALTKLLESEGFGEVAAAESVAGAQALLAEDAFDLVLCDLQLPDGTALDLLPLLRERPATELVLVTGRSSVESAVAAFRGGAIDYLTKPVDVARLRSILAHVRRAAHLRGEVSALRGQLRRLGRFGRLVGTSEVMSQLYDQILKVAATDATVLITGETGTGKEVVAATLHDLSPRAEGPFCPLNCGAVAANLIESELFGHERGSFTGATSRHRGIFERAHGGTLFLDEISEMPIELQVRLLRALESGEVLPIGSGQAVRVDVRVVAATNRDPQEAVEAGRLREDLLYRLLVFPLRLPPLRERGDDVLVLADHFLAEQNREAGTRKVLTANARARLSMYPWPGNVRELRHAVERAFILADDALDADHFPLAGGVAVARPPEELGIHVGMRTGEAERILTLATLERYGERKKTAEVLGISEKTLYNRLKSYRGA